MNYRKKIGLYIVTIFLLMFLCFIFSYPNYFALCNSGGCNGGFRDSVGLPMIYLFGSVQTVFLILLTLRKEIFEFCLRFLIPLTAIYVVFIFSLPVSSCSFMLCFDRWFGSKITGMFFVAASLLIIIGKYIQLWYKERKR